MPRAKFRSVALAASLAAAAAVHGTATARPPTDEVFSAGADGVACGMYPAVSTIAEGGSVSFRGWIRGDASPAVVSWTFRGGRPAAIGDTLNPPSITYDLAGEYPATLDVRYQDHDRIVCSVRASVSVGR